MTTRRATGRQPGWLRGEWGQRRIWLALAVLIAALACARPVSARAYEMPRVVILLDTRPLRRSMHSMPHLGQDVLAPIGLLTLPR